VLEMPDSVGGCFTWPNVLIALSGRCKELLWLKLIGGSL